MLIHDLASILSFSKVSLCYFINVRLFQLETWMKTNLVSLLNNYGSDDLTTSETSTSWNYLFMLVSIKSNMIILTSGSSKLNISKTISPISKETSIILKLSIVPFFCTIVKISSASLLYDWYIESRPNNRRLQFPLFNKTILAFLVYLLYVYVPDFKNKEEKNKISSFHIL